jgi:hypothetical protein
MIASYPAKPVDKSWIILKGFHCLVWPRSQIPCGISKWNESDSSRYACKIPAYANMAHSFVKSSIRLTRSTIDSIWALYFASLAGERSCLSFLATMLRDDLPAVDSDIRDAQGEAWRGDELGCECREWEDKIVSQLNEVKSRSTAWILFWAVGTAGSWRKSWHYLRVRRKIRTTLGVPAESNKRVEIDSPANTWMRWLFLPCKIIVLFWNLAPWSSLYSSSRSSWRRIRPISSCWSPWYVALRTHRVDWMILWWISSTPRLDSVRYACISQDLRPRVVAAIQRLWVFPWSWDRRSVLHGVLSQTRIRNSRFQIRRQRFRSENGQGNLTLKRKYSHKIEMTVRISWLILGW